jgi:hypothetical protein
MSTWRGGRTWFTRSDGPDPVRPTLQRWVATLSRPWVEVLILEDHLIVRQDGELVAAGSILALPPAASELC